MSRGGISAPEWFVILTSLIFGSIFALSIPFGAGWDEETHLIRTWDLAHLVPLPNSVPRNQLPYPIIYEEESYRRQLLPHPINLDEWRDTIELPLDAYGLRYSELESRSVYPPVLLLPQALAIRYLALPERLPALPAAYAARLLGVIAYTVLAWFAVRIVPVGKWTFALLALTPTAVFLSATIGADPISNGFGLVFIAVCLAVAQRRWFGWGSLAAIFGASVLLFMAKPNMVALALLPLLILPPKGFRMRGGLAMLAIGLVGLALALAGGWSQLAYPDSLALPQPGGVAPVPSLPLSSLSAFVRAAALDWVDNGRGYLEQWIARFGYDYWEVPPLSYALFMGGVVAAILADGAGLAPCRRTRAGLALTFLAAVVLTQLVLYIKDSQIGGTEILGVQGRYFIPFAPLLLVSIIGLPRARFYAPVAGGLPAGLALTSLGVYAAGLVLSYYITCGGAWLNTGECILPAYKNWMPNASYTAPIESGAHYVQEILPECNGLREVRLWVDQGEDPGAGGELILDVEDALEGRQLVSRRLSAPELPSGDWLTVRFPPERSSAGRFFRVMVLGQGAAPESGPRLALSLKPEYTDGRLLLDGQPMAVDLVFKYSCLVGVRAALPAATQ